MRNYIEENPKAWLITYFIVIISMILLVLAFGCKTPNHCNHNNKAGQGKYWHQGAKKNWHRL